MKCPFCGYEETKVTDSRNQADANSVKRRRQCLSCEKRFTTFESIDLTIQVKKRDGSFEAFRPEKLISGLDSACRHTRISHDQVLAIASDVATDIMASGVREIDSLKIGEIVMKKLANLDAVAYVRFACVYRRFKDKNDLMSALVDVVE
ncbi:transcriptional regulator NrdR [bacterium]|nr:transcriptional regulator NrdR [bacterium]